MIFAIPLAWLQLKREKIRLLVAIAGISFAVILMFLQLGFRDALFESAVRFHITLHGDIFLISPKSTALIAMQSFSERPLYRALGAEGVESVTPIYLGLGIWRNPEPGKYCGLDLLESSVETNRCNRSILVIGYNPNSKVLDSPEIEQNLAQMRLLDVVLFDRASRAEFGDVPQLLEKGGPVVTEIARHRVTIGGLFSMGASFGADGNLLSSDETFLRIFSERQLGLIDIGQITLTPGANLETVLQDLRTRLASDNVRILSKAEFVAVEKGYWQNSTSIGFIFTLGTAMGFVVGTIIVYQILYTDVSDHLPEYATLKAMGYKSFYLLTVVFQEAIILSFLGFIPGFLLSWVLYIQTRTATSLPLYVTRSWADWERTLTILGLTVFMCCLSGLIAMRKVQAADPADIF